MRDQHLVFGGPHAPGKWSKNKAKLDQLSGGTDFVTHQLGRIVVANLVLLGVYPHVRERVLNHVIPGVEGRL